MKVNNYSEVTLRQRLVVPFILIDILFMFIFYRKGFIFYPLFLIFIGLIFYTRSLRKFQFENTGQVITIKYFFHPFFKKNLPDAEFPIEKVTNVIFRRFLFSRYIVFGLGKNRNGKNRNLYYRIQGFSDKKVQNIKDSFEIGN